VPHHCPSPVGVPGERRLPFGNPGQAPGRTRGEALLFAVVFALAYAALATTFFTQAPRLFRHLDQVFDADLGVWAITLTRSTARLPHYMVHPLITLFVLPWGIILRELLRWGGVHLAGRLAAGLLCALAVATGLALAPQSRPGAP